MDNYEQYEKTVVYSFTTIDGGIGDYIKYFMCALELCIRNNYKLYHLINNISIETHVKLKFKNMYIRNSDIYNNSIITKGISNILNDVTDVSCNTYYIVYPMDMWSCADTANMFKVYNYNILKFNSVFEFSDEVKINSDRLLSSNITNYISIHLRLGDKYLETDKSYIFLPNDTRSFFEERIYKVIEDNYNRNIIFFCDNNTFKLKLKNIYNNINITNCNIGHTGLLNTTHEQVLDTIAEFYLMTNSEKIYMGSLSGFPMTAAKFNNIPLISLF